jgi:CSLREA domain-containing protein
MKRPFLGITAATMLALAVIWGASGAEPAYAATTITVNTTSDEAVTDGQCSLREAISNANANADTTGGDCVAGSAGADTIDLPSVSGTITLGSNLPVITDDLTTNGPGSTTLTINANGNDYVLSVGPVRATIAGLTLTGASVDGALVNAGTVTVENSAIDGNSASAGFNFSGGISNGSGTLTIQNSTVTNNRSLDSLFNGFGFGGGITNNGGTTNLANSVVTGNSARFGGGIENRGTLTVESSTISGNSTSNDSGGIRNEGTGTIKRSTISGNSAGVDFGGGITNGGTLTVENSTISGNSVRSFGTGGGIWNATSAVLTVVTSTISGNNALIGGAIDNFVGTVTIEGTILADQGAGGNCSGLFINSDGGYNLDDGSSCNFSSANHSLSNTDPLLDPLALKDNGGPTQTIALEPGSPAIDAILSGVNGCGTTITSDQRGISRPQGAGCDIGAFELAQQTVAVKIDIKPGDFPNVIDLGSKGTIPVAVLSTRDFSAPKQVRTTSLKFGRTGDETSLASCSPPQDVNKDGLLDVLCHFSAQKTGFSLGDTHGVLTGKTLGEASIRGTDSVAVVRSS